MAPRVAVVGLGPATPALLTEAARALLAGPGPVFLRTRRHPSAAAFPGAADFDHHYETAADFDEVYARIVEDLVAAAQRVEDEHRTVVYAVPGSPLVAERTVELLLADPRVEVTVEPALSFLDLAWARLGVDPLAAGVRLVDGTRFAEQAAGERGPLLVAQCWSARVLSEVKLAVDVGPGPVPEVTVLHHLGLDDERVTTLGWHDLDRVLEPDHLTSLWIPELAAPVARELVALDELARRLRRDCPWDREQTHVSLARHLLEEAYETADAIDELGRAEAAGDPSAEAAAVDHLEEELGDLLFQVHIHSVLAAEEGRFTLADVARGIHDKLVARHPHVFGEVVARSAGAVETNWEAIKKAEKGRESVTDGIPAALPSLALAAKLQRKARSVPGMEEDDFEEVRRAAVHAIRSAPSPDAGRAGGRALSPEQAGDLLWAVADVLRRLGVEPEDALRSAAHRFIDRVRRAETARSSGVAE